MRRIVLLSLLLAFIPLQTNAAPKDDALTTLNSLSVKGRAAKTGYTRALWRLRLKDVNDPLNLLAVDYSLNRQKGDGDAATWLPPLKSYRCAYVARQIAVKAKYALWVTSPEKDAIVKILEKCVGQKIPN